MKKIKYTDGNFVTIVTENSITIYPVSGEGKRTLYLGDRDDMGNEVTSEYLNYFAHIPWRKKGIKVGRLNKDGRWGYTSHYFASPDDEKWWLY